MSPSKPKHNYIELSMLLRRKFTIALLCSSLSSFICMGMESTQEATSYLNSLLVNRNFNVESTVETLILAAQNGDTSSRNLLERVISDLSPSSAKINTPERIGALAQIHYTLGNYEQGFNVFLPLLKENYKGIVPLLDKTLINKAAITSFFTKIKTLEKGVSISEEDLTQITQTFLDSFLIIAFNVCKASELERCTQETIGALYMDTFYNKIPGGEQPIIVSNGQQSRGILSRNKAYFSEGMKYCTLAAKQGSEQAYETLLKALKETQEHVIYYDYLFPFLRKGDEGAQNLFNRISIDVPGTLEWFKRYADNLLECFDEFEIAKRVMNNFANSHVQKQESTLNLPPPSLIKDFFVGETPIQEKLVSSNKLTPSEQYKEALLLWGKNPEKSLDYFFQLRENENTPKNIKKNVAEQLAKIKKTNAYKKAATTTAHSNDIGYLLYQREHSSDNKKASKVTSPPLQSQKKPPVISSFEEKITNTDPEKLKLLLQGFDAISNIDKFLDSSANIIDTAKKTDTLDLKSAAINNLQALDAWDSVCNLITPLASYAERKQEVAEPIDQSVGESSNNSSATPSEEKQPRTTKAKREKARGKKWKHVIETQNNSSPELIIQQQNITTPVVEMPPEVEEKPDITIISTPLQKKRKEEQEEGKTTLSLQMVNNELPNQSQEETLNLPENKVKTNKTLRHERKEKERKTLHKTRSLSQLPRSSSKNFEEEPVVNKLELPFQETEKNEFKHRKILHRTQSLRTLPSSFFDVSEEEPEKKEKKPKKPSHKQPSLKEFLRPEKKLERRNSQNNLTLLTDEEEINCSSSEISTSDTPLIDLFKQEGKQDNNLKRLKKLLANRELRKAAEIKLNRSIVIRALRELGPNGKKIITWNFEAEGNKNESIIRADIIRTADNANLALPTLNIHLHSRKGKWYDDENIKNHFLKFIRFCDSEVNTLIEDIEKNNNKK